ncbi:MAG: HAMP domain-containing histidine kinase, partial [Verrucomicrobiales bacterium]|nr:HAMP domain-containing histidine kinase [Verrucomicrobiales bacterium]
NRPESSESGKVDEILRPRVLALEAYRSLAAGRPKQGDNAAAREAASRGWRDAMLFYYERRTWIALRDPRPGNLEWVPPVPAVSAAGQSIYALVCWNDAFEHLRRVHRARDPRAVFGLSVEVRGADFSMHTEEPSGIANRAIATRTEVHPTGMALKVAVAPVIWETVVAPQQRRERVLGGLVAVAAGLSVLAAGITWVTLVRQHRLGIQKSNFVAGVSHELRAPLASVRLLADNLENDRVAEPERRTASLRLIGRECRRLGALVDNVLDLSRIERGTKRIEPEPTDIPALVRATVASATVGAGERGVTIREAFAPDCVALVASVDPSAFQQALTNLLDNAVKHAPDGTEVIVGLERVASDPRRFAVVVSDSGPGVPESDRRRVFEPFVRLGNELRREQPGIGIGLAIVRHVVEAHGGRVRVEAASPRGARFVLELPVGLDEAGEDGSGGGAS